MRNRWTGGGSSVEPASRNRLLPSLERRSRMSTGQGVGSCQTGPQSVRATLNADTGRTSTILPPPCARRRPWLQIHRRMHSPADIHHVLTGGPLDALLELRQRPTSATLALRPKCPGPSFRSAYLPVRRGEVGLGTDVPVPQPWTSFFTDLGVNRGRSALMALIEVWTDACR